MEQFEKVKNSQFGTVVCDYYGNGKGEFFMTRQQIGQALEYDNPKDAIKDIHRRHKDRLDKFSVERKLTSADGKQYNTYLYSAKGVYEICRWSRQPKADEFYDYVYDILEGLRLGYLKLTVERNTQLWMDTRQNNKENRLKETDVIKLLADYAKKQGSTHSDRLYTVYTKLAKSVIGGKRDNVGVSELNNLTLVENIILRTIQIDMSRQMHYKDIYKDCKNRIEQFTAIAYLTV